MRQSTKTTFIATIRRRAGLDRHGLPAGARAGSSWAGRFRLGLGGAGPEREYSAEGGLGLVGQGAGVVAEAFGGLEAGDGDLRGEAGGGLAGSAVDEELAQLVGDLLRLHRVAGAQLRVLLDELEVAGVVLGVGGRLGAEGQDDRAELFEGLGRVSRGGGAVGLPGCRDRVEQFLLFGENDLLLVAEVAEEGGTADFGALGDVADRDLVEAARGEELLGGLDDALPRLAPLALHEGQGRGHDDKHTGARLPSQEEPSALRY